MSHKRVQNTGLTNPLKLVTSKTMFSVSSFEDMHIAPKLVIARFERED